MPCSAGLISLQTHLESRAPLARLRTPTFGFAQTQGGRSLLPTCPKGIRWTNRPALFCGMINPPPGLAPGGVHLTMPKLCLEQTERYVKELKSVSLESGRKSLFSLCFLVFATFASGLLG